MGIQNPTAEADHNYSNSHHGTSLLVTSLLHTERDYQYQDHIEQLSEARRITNREQSNSYDKTLADTLKQYSATRNKTIPLAKETGGWLNIYLKIKTEWPFLLKNSLMKP